MNPAKAKRLAPLYGWHFWYDRAQRTWCLTRIDSADPEPSRYIAPAPLAQLSESAFRERYLTVDAETNPVTTDEQPVVDAPARSLRLLAGAAEG